MADHQGFSAKLLATGFCKRPDMNKSIRLPAPHPGYCVDACTPDHPETLAFSQRIPMANARPASSELVDRIQIWVNEGGAGGEVG